MGSRQKKYAYTTRNRIRFIKTGGDYFHLLADMINRAQYVIHLQFYIFCDDDTGKQVGSLLINAARRGVQVYLHVDAYASRKLSQDFITELSDGGVHFKWFEPIFKSWHFYFGRRMHHKVVVTDGLFSLVGGMNISDRYNDMPDHAAWLDAAIYCEGEASYQLHNICVKMWGRNILPDKFSVKDIEGTLPTTQCSSVRIRRNDWVRRKREIWTSYFSMFNNAEEKIMIMCSYCLPGRLFRKRLAMAARRGVQITIILAGTSDVMLAKHAERFLYTWMLKNNIRIYEYRKNVLHAKIAVYDGKWTTIGSYNINNISAYASLELNMDIRNRSFANGVEKYLDNIIQEHCTPVTLKSFTSHNHFFKRLWQRVSYSTVHWILNLFTFYFKQEKR